MDADMAAHVLMHHPKLKVERLMPAAAVKHWERRGWKQGEYKPRTKRSGPQDSTDTGDDVGEQQKGEA